MTSEGDFEWSDGSSADYTHWGGGQPDDGRGWPTEDCAHYWGGTGSWWNDMYCWYDNWYGIPIFYICEASID